MNRKIAIIGASGFIGLRLVSALLSESSYSIRVLSRDRPRYGYDERFGQDVEVYEGDLGDPDSLKRFLAPGCTVINLAYLWNAGPEINLACIHNLLTACKESKVRRLLHCSTAAVAGRSPNDLIDENTQCLPINEYGTTKLKIEHDITEFSAGHFEALILRPTSVFGINGEPLKKLVADIYSGSRWRNYLKSCLFGRRRMNLVHVDNVVAALIFLADCTGPFEDEIFIASSDDDPENNFIDVENLLMEYLGVQKYCIPRLPVPLIVLQLMLTLLGRNNVNPKCNFDPIKLHKLGFTNKLSLREGLVEYAQWYRASITGDRESEA